MAQDIDISRLSPAERIMLVEDLWDSIAVATPEVLTLTSAQRAAEPVKRLTIDIPVNLHRRVKTACAMDNLVMADVVREMLERRFPPEKQAGDTATIPAASTETQKHDS
jgi:putative addiction module component (TIGR02574 family)